LFVMVHDPVANVPELATPRLVVNTILGQTNSRIQGAYPRLPVLPLL
jgi:hypothetical protein